MSTKLFLLCCVLLWAGLAAAAAVAPANWGLSDPERMHRFIEQRLRQTEAPGATWAAVQDGALAYSGATGLADPDSRRPFTSSTPTEIGSISKPFTAVAVMQLVETGAVELDAPVIRYLPNFKLADTNAAQQITVRHLLSHTSGISTLAGNLTQGDVDRSAQALQGRVQFLAEVRPTFRPGDRWQYSNANYQILGALIEEISGMEYAQYVERNILRPLDMADSYVVAPPNHHARAAIGHRPWFGQWRPVRSPLKGRGSDPQGGLVVSGNDIGKFLAMMLNGRDDILLAETKAEMMREQPGAKGYGLGWHIRDSDDLRLVWHSGASPGFVAAVAMDPTRQAAFAIATNAQTGFALNDLRSLVNGTMNAAFGIESSEIGPRPIRLATYGLLLLIPLVAAVYVGHLLLRRQRRLLKKPTGFAGVLVKIVIPALLFVGAAYGLLVSLPSMFTVPLSAAWVFHPDTALLLVVAAVALLLLGLVRTWALLTASKPIPTSGNSS